MVEPLYDFVITRHAASQMRRRGISETEVLQVLKAAEQEISVQPNRRVFQSRVRDGMTGIMYLIRIVADVDRNPAEVVTAYKTSKILRYWEGPAT